MFYLIWMTQLCVAEPVESEERAKELFYNGQLLYEEERYEAAILAWQKGYDITELPAFLKNIALAQESAELYSEAIGTLQTYRAFAPFEEQEELKNWLEELEEKVSSLESKTAAVEPIVETPLNQDNTVPNEISELPSEEFKWKPMWTVGITAGTVTVASLTTIQSQRLYTEVDSVCDLNNSLLCRDELSETDAINKFNQSRATSIALWGLATVGTGVSVWQLSSSSTQIFFSPMGATFKGQF